MNTKKILVYLCLFLLGLMIFVYFYLDKKDVKIETKINDNCNGLDIVNTSYCLQKELRLF